MGLADSGRIPRVPPYSGSGTATTRLDHGTITLHGRPFQAVRLACRYLHRRPSTPAPPRRRRFRLCPVRSPLLGVSLLFSLPAGTGMFRFPAFASPLGDDGFFSRRVAPFGLPRVYGHLHLAGVFRGLSRPSSPPGARASTARPRSLNSSILANATCPRGFVSRPFSLPLVLSYSLASSSLLLASRLIMSKNFNGYRRVAATSPPARARDSRPGRFHVPLPGYPSRETRYSSR